MPRRRSSVLASLEAMLRVRPDLNLTLCRAFLYIAENPGLSVVELARLCGCTEATASRAVSSLAGSVPLVRVRPSLIDLRRLAVHLTVRGDKMVSEIEVNISKVIPVERDITRETGRSLQIVNDAGV